MAGSEIFVFVLFCVLSALMESSKWQATPGKRAWGIIVSNSEGIGLSPQLALLRVVTQITGLGYLVALFTPRKQGLHDLIAGTVVVPGTL